MSSFFMAKNGGKNLMAIQNETVKAKFLLTHGKFGLQFFAGMDKVEQGIRQRLEAANRAAAEANENPESKPEDVTNAINEAEKIYTQLQNHLKLKGMQPEQPLNVMLGNATASFVAQQEDKTDGQKAQRYYKAFMNHIKMKDLSPEDKSLLGDFKAALVEGTGKDGGFIVPEDITTRINTLKQTFESLEKYVNVQPVSTNKGQRTLEKRAASTPLIPLSEMGQIQQTNQPEFERASYAIEDYAGFLPVSNDLLADTDQALLQFLINWFAKKSIATRNALILGVLNGLTKVAFADYNDIKSALNVDLDPLISSSSTIFTNQDGFNYLDQLTATDGRPLLQPNPQAPTSHMLFGRPLVVLANTTLATTAGKAPFIVGDLKEAVILWDRKQMSLDITTVGGDSWRTNSTEIRAIEREDVTLWDAEAVIYGEITLPTGA
jgi:HK97 family phage major capsid protein